MRKLRRLATLALGLTSLLAAGCSRPAEEPGEPADVVRPEGATFVGREICAECHADEDHLWWGSHHDLAMQEATDATVLGDFRDSTFTYAGVTSTFFRRDGGFFVRTDGPDGELQEYEIAYAFGAIPLQQYLIEFPGGRHQALSICWDTRPASEGGQRWFHLYPDEEITHEDPFHWTGPFQNWNYMCAECHSTNLKKGYLPEEDRYQTTWSELNVSCEACHGPGSTHVEWARAVADGRRPPEVEHMGLAVRLTDPGRGSWIVNPETAKGLRLAPPVETGELETCARCHSRRTAIGDDYVFGRPIADTHRVALLDEGLYHADGQILEEVYVHGSFIQSRMHLAGVGCSDCHEPHSLNLLFPGDDVCARCHAANLFDTPEHHFHKPETEGSHCVDCHMPPKNYMVVDPRHDHSLRIPRPDLTLELGIPNACSDCHRDKSVEWSVEAVARWYGPERRKETHYGEALHAGRLGDPQAPEELLGLLADAELPAIVRATAVDLLGRNLSLESLTGVEKALADTDPLVRRAAASALEGVEPEVRSRLLFPLLDDPVRTVRMQAAQVLASVPGDLVTPQQRSLLDDRLEEYRQAQLYTADRAEGRLNLGWLYMQRGEPQAAEREFRRALEMAPWFGPAYVNLADLYRRQGRDEEGEEVLRAGVEEAIAPAGIHHALGLLLVRQQRLPEALEELGRAAELAPEVTRYAYVWAVGLHSAGEIERALEVLEEAHRRAPADRELLVALATMHRDAGDLRAAVEYGEKLLSLSPGDPGAQRLLQELKGTQG